MISSIFWSVGLSFVGWILTRIDLESKLLLPAVVHFRPNQTKLSQTEITQWKVEHLRKFPLQEIGISLFYHFYTFCPCFCHFVLKFLFTFLFTFLKGKIQLLPVPKVDSPFEIPTLLNLKAQVHSLLHEIQDA